MVTTAVTSDDKGRNAEKHEDDVAHQEFPEKRGVLSGDRIEAAIDITLKEAENPWEVLKKNTRVVAVMAAVLINGIIVGIEFNMAGNMLGIQAFCRQFGKWDATSGTYAIPANVVSIWAATSVPFQLIGMVASGYIGDMVGRVPVLYAIILACVGGSFLESFATTWQEWLGAKIIMGFATGILQAGCSTKNSEIAPRELRGISLSTFNMFMNLGNLGATLIAYGTEKTWPSVSDDRGFRVPLYICIALPVVILAFELIYLVESPSWLIMHDKHDKARKSLKWLYPKLNEEELDIKVAEIVYTLAKETEFEMESKNASFIDCFKGVNARRSFCAIFPALAQPLCGNMLCGPYATYFFSMAGYTNSLSATSIALSVGFACNIIVYFIIDNKRIGRWAILFGGLILMFIGDLGIGVIGSIQPNVQESSAASGLIILFTCILVCGSVSGPGAVGWTYTGESGSARLRAKSNTLGNLGNASIAWVMSSTISYMLDTSNGMGLNVGYFYAGLSAISVVIVYFFIPDYTGRSFAQIDELFERRIPSRKFSKTICNGDYGREI